MFTGKEREDIRQYLLKVAKKDARLSGGAITGSVTIGKEDQWSDIDLAFGVTYPEDIANCLSDYSSMMYEKYQAVHHLDVVSGQWLYRVFFLPNTLQVDIAFAPKCDFRPKAQTFSLVFGEALELSVSKKAPVDELVGWTWLYALHVRSSLARNKRWQAEFMISGMRDKVFELTCRRYNLITKEAREIDLLPEEILRSREDGLVRSLDLNELKRAFSVVASSFLAEVSLFDRNLESKLRPVVIDLVELSLKN